MLLKIASYPKANKRNSSTNSSQSKGPFIIKCITSSFLSQEILLYRQLEDQQVAPPTQSSFWRQECPLTKAFVLLAPFLDQTNTIL